METLNPQDWEINQICRFEGKSNPSDNSILYAISKKESKNQQVQK